MSGRQIGGAVLLVRYAVAHRGVLGLAGAVVAALAFLSTIAPAAVSDLLTDSQRHEIGLMVPQKRDLVAEEQLSPPPELADDEWAGMRSRLAAARSDMGPLLRSFTDLGEFTVTSPTRRAVPTHPVGLVPTAYVNTSLTPELAGHVRMIEGALPARPASVAATAELVLSRKAADEMRWAVGEERVLTGTSQRDRRYRLSGIYAPIEPNGSFWRQTSAAIVPVVFDDGRSRTITATAWVSGAGTEALGVGSYGQEPRTKLWFPFHAVRATSAQAPQLVDELSAFTRTSHPLTERGVLVDGNASFEVPPVSASYSTQTTTVLRATQLTARSLISLTALLAAGPVTAALCVLALTIGLVRARSAALLGLVTARGASRGQLAVAATVVGLLVGVPSAALGTAVSAVLAPASSVVPWWPPVVCVVLLAAASSVAALSGGQRPRVPRLAVEVIVVGAAAVSLVAVAQRGSGLPGSGIDPLLIAAPVLVCLSGALVARRLLPRVAGWVAAQQRRRTGLVGLMGASRTRDGATSAAAVVALVAATGMAIAAGAAVATLGEGRLQTAQAVAGADLRVSGVALDPAAVARLGELPGVREVATLSDGADVPVRAGASVYVARVLTDASTLRAVQRGAAGAVPGLATLAAGVGADGRVPVIVSESADARLDAAREITVDGVDARVVAVAPDRLGGVPKRTWLLMDRDSLGAERPTYDPTISALADLDGPASDGLLVEVEAMFPGAVVTTTAREAAAVADDPAVGGVNAVARVAAASSALLVAATVVLALVGGATARARDLAVVRALGLPSRLARRLPVWEVALLVVTAGVLGAVVGLVLPYAVFDAVDLTPFTGGEEQPATVLPLGWTLAVAAGVAVVSIVGALLAAGGAARRDLTTVLRMMESE
ncbi:FtsX-like permease family protein [Mumia zhuanghuii]|uniref:FtsX-like permease family protein n=2 Tax=Mumia TaxID=1546255 RepID=A0ABW1QMM7_9ACTN|nr:MULTISPECIES: FtsX-like permease family protein [Mumia]KAA1424960.1 FtsX-like permease family protein [Mumia zhuanghuii]